MTADDDVVEIRVLDPAPPAGPTPPSEGDRTQFGRRPALFGGRPDTRDIPVRVAELSDSLREVTGKLQRVFDEQQAADDVAQHGFELESFAVTLAVNASGRIALIGEMGVEGSLQVTFRRRPRPG